MSFFLLAAATQTRQSFFYENWIIVKQLIWLFGKFMDGIMIVLDKCGIHNIALCIVIFTIITKMVLTPFTVKQQKSSRMSALIQPEIAAIQKKYKGKNDSVSQQKMLAEQRAVQEKYGVSMTAGCLPLLIQMPILFALYPVIYNMDKYVAYLAVLKDKLTDAQLLKMYRFMGINLSENPGFKLSLALIIPILVGVSQYVSTKVSMGSQPAPSKDNPMGNSMKSMNVIMPIMLAVFAINLPAFLGLYWIVQALVMAVQSYFINKRLSKKSVDEMIKENIEKANKKRAKKGLPEFSEKANMSTRNIVTASSKQQSNMSNQEKEEARKKATEYYNSKAATPGSLAAKANMVRDYNERTKK